MVLLYIIIISIYYLFSYMRFEQIDRRRQTNEKKNRLVFARAFYPFCVS